MFCHWTILDLVIICNLSIQNRILLTLKALLLTLYFTLKSTTEEDKKKTKKLRQTWWLHFSNSHLVISVAIFQHMECTFHNSYVIWELVPSRAIFRAELSCWRKLYSNKTIIRWSSRSGWPLRTTHISNDNGYFTFYVDLFFPLSLPRLLPD